MITIPIVLSDGEKGKIKSIFELARQGFNHLACLDLTGRENLHHLRQILLHFYNDGTDSPSRLLAAELALSLRKRDKRPAGELSGFKRLGGELGVIHLATDKNVEVRGAQITVMRTLNLIGPPNLIDQGKLKYISLEASEEAVHVSLILDENKLDKTGAARIKSKYRGHQSMKGLHALRKAKKDAKRK